MSNTLDQQFQKFHQQNPDFYQELISLAKKARDSGKTRVSMRMLFEVIRYRRTLLIKGAGEYEINNSYTPYYSRLIKQQEPDLAHLFETRGSRPPSAKVHAIDDVDEYDLQMMMSLS